MSYEHKIQMLKEKVTEIWDTPEFKDYTDHGIGHCERVNHFALELGKIVNINELESYILEVAGYTHDIGMQANRFFEEKQTEEEIRKNHHDISVSMIEGKIGVEVDEEIVTQVIELVRNHRTPSRPKMDKINELEKEVRIGNDYSVRTRLLASIFRLSDELDISYKRINRTYLEAQLNDYSKYHWLKSYFIDGVGILNDGDVIIRFRAPSNLNELVKNRLAPVVYRQIENHIRQLNEIFTTHGLRIRLAEPGFAHFPYEIIQADNKFWQFVTEDFYKAITPTSEELNLIDLYKKGIIDNTLWTNIKARVSNFSRWDHVELQNGVHTNCFVDLGTMLSESDNLDFFTGTFEEIINKTNPTFDLILGVGTAGTMLATRLSIVYHRPAVLYTPDYQSGLGLEREIPEGARRVVVIDDIVATGQTASQISRVLKEKRISFSYYTIGLIPSAITIDEDMDIYYMYELVSIMVNKKEFCPICWDFELVTNKRVPLNIKEK